MLPRVERPHRLLGRGLSDLTQFILADEAAAVRSADEAAAAQAARAARILDGQNPVSVPFVLDRSPYVGLLAPRRSSKSFSVSSKCAHLGETRPGSRCLIISTNLKATKDNYWKRSPSGIFTINQRFDLGMTFHHTDLVWYHQNGSTGRLAGCETRADIETLRGAPAEVDLVVVDECKSIPWVLLEELLRDVLEPGTMTRDGQIVLAGTPGTFPRGPFWEATDLDARDAKGRPTCRRAGAQVQVPESLSLTPSDEDDDEEHVAAWDLYTWTIQDNVKVPGQWKKALRIKQRAGWDDENPTWRREYLGQWVTGSTGLVYAYGELRATKPEKVTWIPEADSRNPTGLPPEDGPWHLLMSLDFGFMDDTGLLLAAYSERLAELRHVYDEKHKHMLPDDVARMVERVVAKYGLPEAIVGDAGSLGGKVYVETLAQRHGIHVEKADKAFKNDFMEYLNTDFHAGRVKIIPGSDLDVELCGLRWHTVNDPGIVKDAQGVSDPIKGLARLGKLREDPSCQNNLCDPLLYMHRFSYHFFSRGNEVVSRTPSQRVKDTETFLANRRAQRVFSADGHPGIAGAERPVTRDTLFLQRALNRR